MKKILAVVVSLVGLQSSALAADAVPQWQMLADKSTIEWTAMYGGKPVKGGFPQFESSIAFDPAHLDASHASIKITVASVKSEDKDAQENLPMTDWFAASQFPLATFETTGFMHTGDDRYEATGTLSIRNKSATVLLPFTAKFYDDKDASPSVHYARIDGETTVNRLDFEVGQGDWANTDSIANEVKIAIHLEAKEIQ